MGVYEEECGRKKETKNRTNLTKTAERCVVRAQTKTGAGVDKRNRQGRISMVVRESDLANTSPT